ncbi:epsin-3 isoform X3 [Pseudonaja textilis]|uniref:Epsin 3 n=1 Tax=Pseudonaja textilis TaxID=8673 RepID=A0A670Y623_PSETE|nr:epsin-3 isoform X3 [Pseudonaja textilis]
MTTSALRRQVKNIVHNYSEAEIKVREATSNDPWGPPSSLMSEIADLTFNTVAFAEVMGMIWRRLNDSGKNWRHVYKALTLLDYLIKTGSEKVAHQCRENLYTIQTLKEFQYIDRDGKDQGINVREKVKQVMSLLKDEDRLKQERAYALKTKERMSVEGMGISSSNSNSHQLAYGRRASQYGDDYSRSRGSPSSFNSSSSSPRFSSDLEQARPQTTGEEELQLQLALAMSREEAEKQPLPPVSSTDEDLQLQIALTLSKQEHEKEVRAWKGENSLLQKALEESNLDVEEVDDKEKKTQSSVLELADIFGPAAVPSTHTSADPWDIPDNSAFDLFAKLPESVDQPEHEAPSSVKANSSGDVDLFGELIPSAAENGIQSKDIFDIASLGDSLPDSKEKDNKAPETFLGPSASSLVNLDSLVTVPQSVKSRNPFLAGLSAPSPTNPFNVDQPKPTLNQMRTNSPVPSVPMGMPMNSMTYSASLPLPLSSIPSTMTLPASVSAFPQAGAGPFPELPSNLPQPLLPLSGSIPPPLASQSSMNPFL